MKGLLRYKTIKNQGTSNALQIKDGETKQIRFLEDGAEIHFVRRHWVDLNGFKGFVNCLNNPDGGVVDECPLCDRASTNWGSPISTAQIRMLTKVIDRADGKAKLFEATHSVIDKLAKDYDANKTITDVDYSYSRSIEIKGKRKRTRYDLDALRNTASPLSDDDKKKGLEVDVDGEIKRTGKSKEEIIDIINKIQISKNPQENNSSPQGGSESQGVKEEKTKSFPI